MASRDKLYISKSDDVQALYHRLKDEKADVPTKPFRFDRDIFLAAVATGFEAKDFRPLATADRKERFVWGTLLNDEHALSTLRAIALLKTNQPDVLIDDDQVATIAEGYANGGIHLLAKKLLDTPSDEIEEAMLLMTEVLEAIPNIGHDEKDEVSGD
jgi:hypothetical protein